MIQLGLRPEKDFRVKDMEYRIGGRGRPGGDVRAVERRA
jgi:hypothetical protein